MYVWKIVFKVQNWSCLPGSVLDLKLYSLRHCFTASVIQLIFWKGLTWQMPKILCIIIKQSNGLSNTLAIIQRTRHVFVKNRCPGGNKVKIWQISKSYILTPPLPWGHVMSVRCEQPLDDHTVKVKLLYHQSNFRYCTLSVSGTKLRTNGRPNRQTDGQTIQFLDAPGWPLRRGA